MGTPQHPPQIQGQAPKDPQKATPLCHYGHGRGDVLFAPSVDETHRRCRAKAMVVPTGWFELLRYSICELVLDERKEGEYVPAFYAEPVLGNSPSSYRPPFVGTGGLAVDVF